MRVLSTPESDCTDKTLNCQQAHVLRTRHWTGNNLWSPHPVLEAQLLDMDARQWPQLEELLHALLQGRGFTGSLLPVFRPASMAAARWWWKPVKPLWAAACCSRRWSCWCWSRLSAPSNGRALRGAFAT